VAPGRLSTALLVNEDFVLMTAITRLRPCKRTIERPELAKVDRAPFAACRSVIGKWRRPWIGCWSYSYAGLFAVEP